jgi:hypothetical protein
MQLESSLQDNDWRNHKLEATKNFQSICSRYLFDITITKPITRPTEFKKINYINGEEIGITPEFSNSRGTHQSVVLVLGSSLAIVIPSIQIIFFGKVLGRLAFFHSY